MLLEAFGFAVVPASSTVEALDALKGRTPDVIIADYRLRNSETGVGLINAVRMLVDQPVPSIIITGDTAPDRHAALTSSGFPVFHKPIQAPALAASLQQMLADKCPDVGF